VALQQEEASRWMPSLFWVLAPAAPMSCKSWLILFKQVAGFLISRNDELVIGQGTIHTNDMQVE
jgi:hypothetical protein